MLKRLSRLFSLALAAGLFLAGCGEDAPAESSSDEVSGDITVFAASSLSGAFTEVGQAFADGNPGTSVSFNFAASSALVQQLNEGAAADVVAVADMPTMQKLIDGHLVRTPAVFARNRLVIVTKAGNPSKIKGLADLAQLKTVSLCGAEVPCGAYAAEALKKANVTLDESSVTRGQNVAAALAAVAEGDADAGVVYASDAKAAGARVATIAIPEKHNVLATYPIARIRVSENAATARAFERFVRGSAARRILRGHGFLATT